MTGETGAAVEAAAPEEMSFAALTLTLTEHIAAVGWNEPAGIANYEAVEETVAFCGDEPGAGVHEPDLPGTTSCQVIV